MKKITYKEILFFFMLICAFLIPSFAKLPSFINEEGCDCDGCIEKLCEVIDYIVFGDVEEMDVFVKVSSILQGNMCNIKSRFFIKDNSNNIIVDEFTQYGSQPTEKPHSYENQLWVRTVTFDRAIDSDGFKNININDPTKFKMTFYACLTNTGCDPPLERQVVPMSYEVESFGVSSGRGKLVIVFKGPWNYLGCIECCP